MVNEPFSLRWIVRRICQELHGIEGVAWNNKLIFFIYSDSFFFINLEILPVTRITRLVLVSWAANSSTNTINILIGLGAVLSKINTSSKHTTNVSMSFIEAFLNNRVYKWWSMEQHSLATLLTILFGYFLSTMSISFIQLPILNLLNLKQIIKN